jgi:hypothetical protein
MSGALDGALVVPDAGHPLSHFVPRSIALDFSDPTGWFHLQTLSIAGPSTIMDPILDTVVVSHDLEDASCEELGW